MENTKKTKLIPFDLKRALNGSKVITGEGNTVLIAGYNQKASYFEQLLGWIISKVDGEQKKYSWANHGEEGGIYFYNNLYMAETPEQESDRLKFESNISTKRKDIPGIDRPLTMDDVRNDKPDLVGAYIGPEPQQATEEQFKENMKKLERPVTEHTKGLDYYINRHAIKPDELDELWRKATRQPLQFRTSFQYPEQYLADINLTLKEILNKLKAK